MSESITLNKDHAQFFISINKKGGHSFIMLGVYDQNEVSHVLCRVGKFFDLGNEVANCFTVNRHLFSAVFSNTKGILKDEGVIRERKGKLPISYQAYDISYRQYLEFLQILEGLQTDKNQFKCYKPFKEEGHTVELELTSNLIFTPKKNIEALKKETSELGVGNTCRHTAIKLVEQVQHAPISSLISSVFFRELPYKTRLDFGKPSSDTPFYVLPAPPTAYPALNEKERDILTKLYTRMERMLLINQNSIQTKNKFNSLKGLYAKITTSQEELTLEQLLNSVQTWKEENKLHLHVLRETFFWDAFFVRESATTKLIAKIEQDLSSQINETKNTYLIDF